MPRSYGNEAYGFVFSGCLRQLEDTDIAVRMRLWGDAKSPRIKLDSKYQVNVAQLHGRRPANGVVKQHTEISMSSLGCLDERPTARAWALIASVFNGALRAWAHHHQSGAKSSSEKTRIRS
ncbi:hypothetical protein SLT36_02340 [Aminobacter sp. BA135]|uniref:hypothetical protein n=1 Tax=Aminobacter sp. BA135 TaxID=537596 RepID=UPI003D791740